ncbi:cysteine--tRNA ligase [Candidatus Woesearchaeota archaeon]|nr:cysteine--tRNA ligase [Candidatus Woesearchaeota archaeon]
MKLYDTLVRKKVEFKPLKDNTVRVYTCGPTVYGPLHLGHVRTAVAYDFMLEYFRTFKKYKVLHVMNITDVGHIVGDVDDGEDKIVKAAKQQKIHPMELVDHYIKDAFDGYDALKCKRPNIAPRATGHIVEIQDWTKKLIEKGYAYEVDGDVYFDVSKAKNYGKLSGQKLETLKEAVRIDPNSKKRSSVDFALWKKAEAQHILKWSSPWGEGYPGWHIECSVMSSKYLSTPFDIHGGARELSFPHHENEIAQSEAYTGKKFVNHWVHTGLLLVNGEKMAKSANNFITVEIALKTYSPEQIRWFLISSRYNSEVDFSDKHLIAAKTSLERINNFLFHLQQVKTLKENKTLTKLLTDFTKGFEAAMDDDLNTPIALSQIYDFITKANKQEIDKKNQKNILEFFKKIDSVFKVFTFEQTITGSLTEKDIEVLIKKRAALKKVKNWSAADKIRDELKSQGVELLDQKDGSTIYKRS